MKGYISNDKNLIRLPWEHLPQSHGAVYFCPAGGGAGDRLRDVTYDDIVEGCDALLDRLERENGV